jgi:hypothetical protein
MLARVATNTPNSTVAIGPGPRRLRLALVAAAAVYLAGVWLDAAGAPLADVLPRPLLYFMQVARLFPNAIDVTTEYRAEAYECDQRRWIELDVRPFFPLRADDKENRFDRAMFFYHHSSPVMRALDDYLVEAHNRGREPPIGGVLLLSLRIPVRRPGGTVAHYERRPIADYPPDARKYWYRTSLEEVNARCDQEAYRRAQTVR